MGPAIAGRGARGVRAPGLRPGVLARNAGRPGDGDWPRCGRGGAMNVRDVMAPAGETVARGMCAGLARLGDATKGVADRRDGEGAGLPEAEHLLQACEQACQAGHNQGAQRRRQPTPTGAGCGSRARRGAVRFHHFVF